MSSRRPSSAPRRRCRARALPLLGSLALLAGCASGPESSGDRLSDATSAIGTRTPQFDRGELVTFENDGRLWVFDRNDADLISFLDDGPPEEVVTFVGAGPERRTLRSDDRDTLLAYVAAKPGFEVIADDGRLWVFRPDSEGLAEFRTVGEPAKSVTWIGSGPKGATLRSDDRGVLLEYLAAATGFTTIAEEDDGTWRLWIFENDSEDLADFRAVGEPGKSVTWIGAGPRGTTIRSGDRGTLLRHAATTPGFEVFLAEDERLWVFREGSDAIGEFRRNGELGRSVTRIGAGPAGVTVRSEDAATIDEYLAVAGLD